MKDRPRVLVVEDEPAIAELIAVNLRHAGFEPVCVEDGEAAQRELDAVLPDVILLDWMLPGASGLQLARRWRADARSRPVPILMLTARGDEPDKVAGLDAGADDYITKPFSPRELLARIKSLLRRRAPQHTPDPIEAGGLRLEPDSRRVSGNGLPLPMGPTEFRLLHFLMTHAERVYSRSQLLDQVWGDHVFVEERTVDVHIRRLRKALSPAGLEGAIQTSRGAGYRFSITHPQ